jgi:hypothetical protein
MATAQPRSRLPTAAMLSEWSWSALGHWMPLQLPGDEATAFADKTKVRG